MAHWNDTEKAVALTYDQQYSGHAVHKLSPQQRTELNGKLINDIAEVASW
jgi:hypothetical protein